MRSVGGAQGGTSRQDHQNHLAQFQQPEAQWVFAEVRP